MIGLRLVFKTREPLDLGPKKQTGACFISECPTGEIYVQIKAWMS